MSELRSWACTSAGTPRAGRTMAAARGRSRAAMDILATSTRRPSNLLRPSTTAADLSEGRAR